MSAGPHCARHEKQPRPSTMLISQNAAAEYVCALRVLRDASHLYAHRASYTAFALNAAAPKGLSALVNFKSRRAPLFRRASRAMRLQRSTPAYQIIIMLFCCHLP